MSRLSRFTKREEYRQELGNISALISQTSDPESERLLREYRLQLELEYYLWTDQRHVIY